jgi:hypothetical protein
MTIPIVVGQRQRTKWLRLKASLLSHCPGADRVSKVDGPSSQGEVDLAQNSLKGRVAGNIQRITWPLRYFK